MHLRMLSYTPTERDGEPENLHRLADLWRELRARLRVRGLTDEEARQLPVQLDGVTLHSFGSSTWMTDAGPVGLLADLRDRKEDRHAYPDLIERAVSFEVGAIIVRLAALDDIVASKEFADRDKDRAALPELHELQQRLRHRSPGNHQNTIE